MVSLYFEKAKPIITVAVPNAIMLNLVNTAKDELLRELLPVLGKMKNLNEVFEASRKRQKECIEMTEALNSAQALLAELKGVFSQRSWENKTVTNRACMLQMFSLLQHDVKAL